MLHWEEGSMPSVIFLTKMQNLNLIRTSDKLKLKGIPLNNWPILFHQISVSWKTEKNWGIVPDEKTLKKHDNWVQRLIWDFLLLTWLRQLVKSKLGYRLVNSILLVMISRFWSFLLCLWKRVASFRRNTPWRGNGAPLCLHEKDDGHVYLERKG